MAHDHIGELEWKRRVEADPRDSEALSALYALWVGQERWPEALTVLQRMVEATDSVAERVSRGLELASLQIDVLDDVTAAIEGYSAVLDLDPSQSQALDALEELLERVEDYARLLQVLETRAELADNVDERAVYLLRLAALCEEQLGDRQRASDTYRTVLDHDPGNDEARFALHRLAQLEE